MTEAEAKRYWCPMARLAGFSELQAINRSPQGDPAAGSFCLGSQCMVWRWEVAQEGRSGYCGLASRP
jgi:hypothetical protein